MVEGKHSHQMWLSYAMVQVASHAAYSEQVEVCVEERVKADLDQDSEQVEVCVEERVRADLEGHHCHGHQDHQDQHLTKETLVNQVAVTIRDTRLGNRSCDWSGDLSPTFSEFAYVCLCLFTYVWS